MPHDRFDFAFVQRVWTWTHRIGGDVVDRSSGSFATLSDCIADARKAGFHARAGAHGAHAEVRDGAVFGLG